MKYIMIFMMFLTFEAHTQSRFYTYNGTEFLESESIGIAWYYQIINILDIPNTDIPSHLTSGSVNISLDNTITLWDFTGNGYNLTNDNTLPGVHVSFTTDENKFTNPKTILGVTTWTLHNNKYYKYGDNTAIYINNSSKFQYVITPFTPNAANDEYHLPSILLHELGHAFGLSHNYNNSSSVMKPGLVNGEVSFTLHQDDTDGIIALYDVTVNGFGTTTEYIVFSPPPGTYDKGQLIEMDNLTKHLLIIQL